ncbi:MAG: FHA domain-containing protein, partial [Planctomycetes bacterium]|nr:FHA domain-containing protein [Planctomycetota bacterium]
MSLKRFVYYSAIIGGWTAWIAWLLVEMLVLRGQGSQGTLAVVLAAAIVGASIGGGLAVVSSMTNPHWNQRLKRALPGLIGGAVGGAIGGFMGEVVHGLLQAPPGGDPSTVAVVAAKTLGFLVMGMAIGVADGLFERSFVKIRNGLIGGAIGGAVGGLLFHPLALLTASGTGMSSRATVFVMLGIFIGGLIGLAHVVLCQAWLTVLDGFGIGREMILTRTETVLGRADHLAMPFLGMSNRGIELKHARIVRGSGGGYSIEDCGSQLGTIVNYQRINARQALNHGDLIRLGSNILRFGLRDGRALPTAVPQNSPAPPTGEDNEGPPVVVAPPRGRMAPPPPSSKSASASVPPPQDYEPAPSDGYTESNSPGEAPAALPVSSPPPQM